MESLKSLKDSVGGALTKVFSNIYVLTAVKLALILYASSIAPNPPEFVKNAFKNTFVKIILLACIAYLASVDFQVSLILAIIFVLGTNIVAGRGIFESYQNMILGDGTQGQFHKDPSMYKTLLGHPAPLNDKTIIESKTDIFIGCENLKMDDIMKIFDGDVAKMQDSVRYSFHELLKDMQDSDAKDKFMKTVKAVGLPYNVELNDENAPLIGTILLQYGYKVSDTCRPPHN